MPWGVSLINRSGFMAEINNLLVFMNEEDRQRVMKRYDSMFDQAGPEGEETLVRCFGSPVRQVLQIEQEYRDAVAQGKTPFLDVDIQLPTSGMEDVWQPEEKTPLTPAVPAEGIRSIPEPAELPAEPVIPEEPPAETIAEAEVLPPEPVVREITPVYPEAEDAVTIPEIVAEEQMAEELPAPAEVPVAVPPEPEPVSRRSKREQGNKKPGAGRVVGSVLATIPMIAMWILFFGAFIALGAAVLALGAAFAAAAIYMMSYLFSGLITYNPDVMLLAGGILVALGLSLLLIWAGLWIAVGGCIFTVRLSGGIYRKILGTEEEE